MIFQVKPIDQVNVGKLAGSSGTPRGFNAAIQQIRQRARNLMRGVSLDKKWADRWDGHGGITLIARPTALINVIGHQGNGSLSLTSACPHRAVAAADVLLFICQGA